ncbi:MAG: ABC transporter ATP-binding protein, partial [Saccharofermentans sp.]|nr:ABC transporter ATP-binding protein [Saccharofermentans sp.]
MFKTMKLYFGFCNKENRRKLTLALILGTLKAMFAMLKIPAIAIVLQGLIEDNMSMRNVWGSLAVMGVSILGQILVSLKVTMLQTEAGYNSCSSKRIEIAEHLRYLPMGFFNRNSLGRITNITTNTMEQLADVSTRVVMTTTQGIITTCVIMVSLFFFDYRIALILLAGIIIFMSFNYFMQRATAKVAPVKHLADESLVSCVIEYVQGIA